MNEIFPIVLLVFAVAALTILIVGITPVRPRTRDTHVVLHLEAPMSMRDRQRAQRREGKTAYKIYKALEDASDKQFEVVRDRRYWTQGQLITVRPLLKSRAPVLRIVVNCSVKDREREVEWQLLGEEPRHCSAQHADEAIVAALRFMLSQNT